MVARVIELSDELEQQIADLARRTGRTESDLLQEAIAAFVQTQRAANPKSDGTIDDPDLAARDVDAWLAANWRPA
jgi:predicted transcriptional regulator